MAIWKMISWTYDKGNPTGRNQTLQMHNKWVCEICQSKTEPDVELFTFKSKFKLFKFFCMSEYEPSYNFYAE